MKKIIYIQKYHNSSIIHYSNGERKYVNELPYKLISKLKKTYDYDEKIYKHPILINDSLLQPTKSIYDKNCEYVNLLLVNDVEFKDFKLLVKYDYIIVYLNMTLKTFYKLQKINYSIGIRIKYAYN